MTSSSVDGSGASHGERVVPTTSPRVLLRGLAGGGAALTLLAIGLPWWHAGGRWAAATGDGLHPRLSLSLALLTLAGAGVAFRATRSAGGRLDVFHAGVGVLASLGVAWAMATRWGSADRGIAQPVALIGAALVVSSAFAVLTPPPPPSAPSATRRARSRRSTTPTPTLTADVFPVWFYVPAPEPIYGPDGQAVVSLLQPGRWYLATGMASAGWVIATDDAQNTGQIRESIVSAGRQ